MSGKGVRNKGNFFHFDLRYFLFPVQNIKINRCGMEISNIFLTKGEKAHLKEQL